MIDLCALEARRLHNWGQTAASRCGDETAAESLIGRAGIVTHYPISPALPNLLDAYTGKPGTKVESEWDSVSGHIYTWRWTLGRRSAGFYTAVVLKRPTWVSWDLLPAVLRLRGELRSIDDVYAAGELSTEAHRIAQALAEAGEPLQTGDLRRLAGFPTGKSNRAAYLRAMTELDSQLMVAKVFAESDEDMRHVLVAAHYPDAVAEASRLSAASAIEQLLRRYLSAAVYVQPGTLAKPLGLPAPAIAAGLDALRAQGLARAEAVSGQEGPVLVWNGE